MTIAVISKDLFLENLKNVLTKARYDGKTHVKLCIMEDLHDEMFQYLVDHPGIERLVLKDKTIFFIKEMRVELEKIDGYI